MEKASSTSLMDIFTIRWPLEAELCEALEMTRVSASFGRSSSSRIENTEAILGPHCAKACKLSLKTLWTISIGPPTPPKHSIERAASIDLLSGSAMRHQARPYLSDSRRSVQWGTTVMNLIWAGSENCSSPVHRLIDEQEAHEASNVCEGDSVVLWSCLSMS